MNPKSLLITIVLAIAGLTIFTFINAPSNEDKFEIPRPGETDVEPPPEIKKKGKQPKAVTELNEYDFGKMARFDTGKKIFTIHNAGESPLELTKGESSCKCTMGNLGAKSVEPGESTEIELEWSPESLSQQGSSHKFRQYAVIQTNDPERPEIQFTVTGFVFSLFEITPDKQWTLGTLSAEDSREITGRIYSRVDDFEILEIDSTNEFISATSRKLTPDELIQYDQKNGYEVTVKLVPGLPTGPIQENLAIKTDHENGKKLKIHLDGFIKGPYTFMKKKRQKGVSWAAHAMALKMGNFRAAEGQKVDMQVFVSDLSTLPEGEQFKVLGVESSLKFLTATVQEDSDYKKDGKARFEVTFEYKPGSPALTRSNDGPAVITFKTNHPRSKLFKVRVTFIAN